MSTSPGSPNWSKTIAFMMGWVSGSRRGRFGVGFHRKRGGTATGKRTHPQMTQMGNDEGLKARAAQQESGRSQCGGRGGRRDDQGSHSQKSVQDRSRSSPH